MELRQTYTVDPTQIEAAHVETPVMPYVDRPSPESGLDGKINFQYTVASALLDGQITIDTFTEARLHRPDLQSLLAKTHLTMDQTIPNNFEEMWITVKVTMRDGQEYSVRCDRPRASGATP